MNVPPVLNAALYHRVSTRDQDPTIARRELRAAAKRHGFKVTMSVEETGSGANNDRPGLLSILDAGATGRIDAVIVWKLDRFGRSALDLLANLKALEACGVRFIAITQALDVKPGGDALSRLLLTVLSAVAEFERELIVERTRMGIDKARRRGIRLGRPPIAKPNQTSVHVLQAQGLSWSEIARVLKCTVWAARSAAKSTEKRSEIT